jgi:hypothetical protein
MISATTTSPTGSATSAASPSTTQTRSAICGPSTPRAPAIRRRLDRPLIGREQELERLRDAFARVTATRTPESLAIVGILVIDDAHLAEPARPDLLLYWPRGCATSPRCSCGSPGLSSSSGA